MGVVHRVARFVAQRPRLFWLARQLMRRVPAMRSRLQRAMQAPWDDPALEIDVVPAVPVFHVRHKAIEAQVRRVVRLQAQAGQGRKKLAFVSPLPPLHSGIADFSAELLPALAMHFDISLIVEQESVTVPWIAEQYALRSPAWLREHADEFDEVLYHFGNSIFHRYMFSLIEAVPGHVVLHDFYLGDIRYAEEVIEADKPVFTQSLYDGQGYVAVLDRFTAKEVKSMVRRYPVNWDLLVRATGVIVHSTHARDLAAQWYGTEIAQRWAVVPLLRAPATSHTRDAARRAHKIQPDEYLVCSFGILNETKLNHRLLHAWALSALSASTNARLIFVGELQPGAYADSFHALLRKLRGAKRVTITGRVNEKRYKECLAAADCAVQLRTQSRGETSAAVLDCLNFGLPTIVNAHGSFTELPKDAVCSIADTFEDVELAAALDALAQNPDMRAELRKRGRHMVHERHLPQHCAALYARALEADARRCLNELGDLKAQEGSAAIEVLARQSLTALRDRQWLVDVSVTSRNDLKTGIQRVVRSIVRELLLAPPQGFRVEPVYLCNEEGRWVYRYARRWTCGVLGIPRYWAQDALVDVYSGDELFILDFTGSYAVHAAGAGVLSAYKQDGVAIHFALYDLLPMQLPQFFPPGDFGFEEWVQIVCSEADGVMCISRAVADDLSQRTKCRPSTWTKQLQIGWFHLGADIKSSVPTTGVDDKSAVALKTMRDRPTFLMVGTIEPRKGYLQAIAAFTLLWARGYDVNLVIVGKQGWMGLPETERRTIPEILRKLQTHPESGHRLFWLQAASDEALELMYEAASCLIAASEGEGFGLPLIEAAHWSAPILARDIPVFREVAVNGATYFCGLAPDDLADAIVLWLEARASGNVPDSAQMASLTWSESAQSLVASILKMRSNM